MAVEITEKTPHGVDKIERYGWVIQNSPGRLMKLDKRELSVLRHKDDPDRGYQRDQLSVVAVKRISASWNWIACGALVVAERDSQFWIIDGQQRWAAAMRRSDIKLLPCVVFKTKSVREEAKGFTSINRNRKMVSILDSFHAHLVARDELTLYVKGVFDKLGLRAAGGGGCGPNAITAIGWCLRYAASNREDFECVLSVARKLYPETPIKAVILDGLWYIHKNVKDGWNNKRLLKRASTVGGEALLAGALRAGAFYTKGGGRVWGLGMMEIINKGLRHKFALSESQDT